MTAVLIDANLFIAAYDEHGTTSQDQRAKAQKVMKQLLNSQVTIHITTLIRYEVLRGVPHDKSDRYEKLKTALDKIPRIEITQDVSDLAAALFRFDRFLALQKTQPKGIDKHRFDVFHYACAFCNQLELKTQNDGDFRTIKALHQRYLTSIGQSL